MLHASAGAFQRPRRIDGRPQQRSGVWRFSEEAAAHAAAEETAQVAHAGHPDVSAATGLTAVNAAGVSKAWKRSRATTASGTPWSTWLRRDAITMDDPIHIYIPGSEEDPRSPGTDPPGIFIHRGPSLHPEDITIVDGIPVTSVSRTLLDCAECCEPEELRAMFINARSRGLLDVAAVRPTRARVEWRPSLAMFDAVFAEFGE